MKKPFSLAAGASKSGFLSVRFSHRPQWRLAWPVAAVLLGAMLIGPAALAQPHLKPAQPAVWPGSTRGDAQALRISGQYAYIGLSHNGLSGGLAVVDISEPTNPVPVGGIDFPGVVCGLYVTNSYAYVAAHSGGVRVVNIQPPNNPVLAGSCAPGGFAWDIQVVGRYAYAAVTDIGLVVLDVSDPTHPLEVSTCPISGWIKKLQVVNNAVYLACVDRLEILTVSNGTNLTRAGAYTPPGSCGVDGVQVSGHYACFSSCGLGILDVSDPAAPVLVATTNLFESSAFRLAGHYAYTGIDPLTTLVFDMIDPFHPVKVGEIYTGEFPQDLEVVGHYIYVAAQSTGLNVFDISNPAKPNRVGGYGVSGSADNVQVAKGYAYVDDSYAGLEVIDVRNPANPVWAGGFLTGSQVTGVQLVEQTLFVSDRDSGLFALDVSQPPNPIELGKTTNIGIVNGFQVNGGYAYLACNSGLSVVDVSDRTRLVLAGTCVPPGYVGAVIAVRVTGHLAYVAIDRDTSVDMGVIDVSDPAVPAFLAVVTNSWIGEIQELGQYLLVSDYGGSLNVYDRSNPANLVLAASFPTLGPPTAISVAGNAVYVCEGNAGVQVFDADNPTNLVLRGTFETHGPAESVFVADKLVYLAEGGKGLVIVPSAPLVQFTLQVDGIPDRPCTIELATNMTSRLAWTTLFTTNSSRMPFWFTDTNAQASPKFYRVHQQ